MLGQLYAERQLAAIEAVSVPKMTQSARHALLSRLSRKAAGPQARARSLHEALGPHARRIDTPKGAKKR